MARTRSAPKEAIMDIVHESDGEITDRPSDEDSDYGSEKRTTRAAAAKRPRLSITAKKAVLVKNAPPRRKTLSLLPTMPLDILFEILGELSPKDLLNVSRTNKLFQETLGSPNARSVWKTSRKHSDAPDCPSDLSEMQCAALLYGSRCQKCGAKGIPRADFHLRRRLCVSCKKANYLVRHKAVKEFPDYEDILLLIPATNVGGWAHGHACSSQFYWRADILSMIAKLATFDHRKRKDAQAALEAFKQQRITLVYNISSKASEFAAWERRKAFEREANNEKASDSRAADIHAKFIDLGYRPDDIDNAIRYTKEVKGKAALTDRIWARIRPNLEPLVQAKQEERDAQLLKDKQSHHRGILAALYNTFRKSIPPREWTFLPRLADICLLEPFSQHIDGPPDHEPTEACFTDTMATLPELLAARKAALMADFVCMLRETPNAGSSGIPSVDADALALATTVFMCSRPSNSQHNPYLFGVEGALTHHCSPDCPRFYMYSLNFARYDAAPPPADLSLSIDARSVVEALVRASGLNPANATVEDMDRVGVRFGCKVDQCNARTLGFDWKSAVVHVLEHDKMEPAEIYPLSQKDAETVKSREMSDGKWKHSQWLCAHCNALDTDNGLPRSKVETHVRQQHQINSPTAPTDLFLYERHVIPFGKISYDTKSAVSYFSDTAKHVKCRHCATGSSKEKDRLFNVSGAVSHIKAKHKRQDPQKDVDWFFIKI